MTIHITPSEVVGEGESVVVDPEGEFPFHLATYAPHLAIIINRERDAKVEQLLRPLGLNVVRHRALSVIGSLESCTMSDLAAFSLADRTTMTRTVDLLVEAGMVVRTTPPTDRRQVILSLTPLGYATHGRSMKVVRDFNFACVEGIDEADLRAAVRTYAKLARNIIADPVRAERLLLREGLKKA